MATASKEESEEDPLPAQVRSTRLVGSEWAKMDRRKLNRLPVQKVVTAGFLTASLHQQLLDPSYPPEAARAILLLLRARKRICFLEDGVYRRFNFDGWRHDESQVRELGSLRFRSKEAANSIHQLVVSDSNLGPIRRLLEAIFSDQPLDWQSAMQPLGLQGVPIALDRQAVEHRYQAWTKDPSLRRGARGAFYDAFTRVVEDLEDGLGDQCAACATMHSDGQQDPPHIRPLGMVLAKWVHRSSIDLIRLAKSAFDSWQKWYAEEELGTQASGSELESAVAQLRKAVKPLGIRDLEWAQFELYRLNVVADPHKWRLPLRLIHKQILESPRNNGRFASLSSFERGVGHVLGRIGLPRKESRKARASRARSSVDRRGVRLGD